MDNPSALDNHPEIGRFAVVFDADPGVLKEWLAVGRGENFASVDEEAGHEAMLPSCKLAR